MPNEDHQTEREMKQVSSRIQENDAFMDRTLAIDASFDLIHLPLQYGGKAFSLYCIDGFTKDRILSIVMNHLSTLDKSQLVPDTLAHLLQTHVGYIEVDAEDDMDKIIMMFLSGASILFIDGESEAIILDARTYPVRSVDEPDLERVVRGPRDGFTETLIFNTALTRRRVRDPSLRMEYMNIGRRSKTDICISFLGDVADPELVETVRKKLEAIRVDGLPMAEKTIEEFIFGKNWNPYPMVRYTERPDVAAVHLFEGHVLVFTDTSPSVMIVPTTLFHHVQHAEEYRQKPIIGAYLRWVRFFAMVLSILLPPLWLLLATNKEILPEGAWSDLIGPKEEGSIPLFWQFLLAELGIDILRMAAVHIPSALATALGLVAAIMIGQVAVEVGLFSNEVILYLAIAVMGTFATPSYELSLANRIVRLVLLVMVFLLGLPGLIIALIGWFVLLMSTKSLRTPYLWPVIPFNGKALLDILVRAPVPQKNKRPSTLSPQDPDRK